MSIDSPAVGADQVGPAGRIAARRWGPGPGTVLVAGTALEGRAEPLRPPLLGKDPGTLAPGRLVPNVLAVAAVHDGHPVPCPVPFEAHDGALHGYGAPGTPIRSNTTPRDSPDTS